jgi:hypothetical protein
MRLDDGHVCLIRMTPGVTGRGRVRVHLPFTLLVDEAVAHADLHRGDGHDWLGGPQRSVPVVVLFVASYSLDDAGPTAVAVTAEWEPERLRGLEVPPIRISSAAVLVA